MTEPETAGLTGATGQPPSLLSHNPARRHAAAARPPRGCAVGAARLRAGTAAACGSRRRTAS